MKRQVKKRTHLRDLDFYQFHLFDGAHVLHIGCGDGSLLRELKPARGVGVSEYAQDIKKTGALDFFTFVDQVSQDKPFDIIILTGDVLASGDVQKLLEDVHKLCRAGTRIFVESRSRLWGRHTLKKKSRLSAYQLGHLLRLANFDIITTVHHTLLPVHIPGVSSFCNGLLANIPLINWLCAYSVIIARPQPVHKNNEASVSVIITCKNERGNIENAVKRIPHMGSSTEIIFVEGGSTDGTLKEIQRVAQIYPEKNIQWFVQSGVGKGDAVRKGFDQANGNILMILDGDLTVEPEELPKFFRAMIRGDGEFINGSRLVYPLEKDAMLFLAFIANHCFGFLLSFIIRQWVKDTLCGTKVLWKKDYQKIAQGRKIIGLHDPYGDFDLLFGAGKLTLKIMDLPIRYKARAYGQSNIQRFRDFWSLLLMCSRAWLVFKVR